VSQPRVQMTLGPKRKKSLLTASLAVTFLTLSERRDLNPRPLAPQASALPGCATFRVTSPFAQFLLGRTQYTKNILSLQSTEFRFLLLNGQNRVPRSVLCIYAWLRFKTRGHAMLTRALPFLDRQSMTERIISRNWMRQQDAEPVRLNTLPQNYCSHRRCACRRLESWCSEQVFSR
jgi:hypothetical protein